MDQSSLKSRRSSRLDQKAQRQAQTEAHSDTRRKAPLGPNGIPSYVIDLSRPPRQRYQALVKDFKDEIATLPSLFDEVVEGHFPQADPSKIRWFAKYLLRGVYNKEENEELKGIHEATGMDMYLLVAFNVLLDLFMGCTSGGVAVRDGEGFKNMLHFRTLDWGMPALRKVIVHLDYIMSPGEPVVASSITYAGYVGVLTGVRPGLSMSLNFRPTHDASTRLSNYRFYFNHLLVLLGRRPSISSILRQCLLPMNEKDLYFSQELESIERCIPSMKTTAAYLIFSNGQRTITMEKDYKTADVQSSKEFIVTTNHDAVEEAKSEPAKQISDGNTSTQVQRATGMEVLVEESTDRKACMANFYEKAMTRLSSRKRSKSSAYDTCVTPDQVIKWMNTYPITNEETHFATVMDPQKGEILWMKLYAEEMTEEMITDAATNNVRRL